MVGKKLAGRLAGVQAGFRRVPLRVEERWNSGMTVLMPVIFPPVGLRGGEKFYLNQNL